MKKILAILSAYILICLCYSCSINSKEIHEYPYGKGMNAERTKVGLVLMNDSLFNERTNGWPRLNTNSSTQVNFKVKGIKKIDKPLYYRKIQSLDAAKNLIMEQDVYLSGKAKPGVDLTLYEGVAKGYVFKKFNKRISVTGGINYHGFLSDTTKSNYKENFYFSLRRIKSINTDVPYYEQLVTPITEKQADSILKVWHLLK